MGRLFALILILLTVFSSCKMGKNYKGVEVVVDSTFRFNNDSIIMASEYVAAIDSNGLKWWEMFNDEAADTLVKYALNNNKNALIAIKRMEQAALFLKIQKAEGLPKFDVNANIARGNYAGFVTDGANTNFLGNATINWEIDFWGKFRRLNEAARADFVASQYNYQSIQMSLISQVLTTYYELLGHRASYEISIKTLATRDSSLQIIQQRFDQGIVPEIDLNQAQVQKAIAASAVPVYKRNIAITENTLSILLGINPKSFDGIGSIKEIEPVPEIPTGLPSQLLLRRPDVLQAEQGIVAENARVGAAQAARWPAISLTGMLGIASSELSGFTEPGGAWQAGAGLAAPLFYFGQNKRRVEEQRKIMEAAILNYEQVVLQSFKDVEDALIKIETYKEEIIARRQHVEAAVNAQALSKLRYDKGVTSYLEYLEQQKQAFEAQLRLVDAEKDLYTSYVELYKALGGGWATPQ